VSSSLGQSITEAINRQAAYIKDGAKWRALTDSVVHLIAKEMLPFNIVEKPAFQKMLQTFDRQYEFPRKHTYLKRDILYICFYFHCGFILCLVFIQEYFKLTETESPFNFYFSFYFWQENACIITSFPLNQCKKVFKQYYRLSQ